MGLRRLHATGTRAEGRQLPSGRGRNCLHSRGTCLSSSTDPRFQTHTAPVSTREITREEPLIESPRDPCTLKLIEHCCCALTSMLPLPCKIVNLESGGKVVCLERDLETCQPASRLTSPAINRCHPVSSSSVQGPTGTFRHSRMALCLCLPFCPILRQVAVVRR